MTDKFKSIAVDGPSGAGKSTLSKMIAHETGFIYVDTGAIYRTVGLYIYRKGIGSKDAEAIKPILREIKIELAYGNDGTQEVWLNGENVSGEIRLPVISIYASDVSAIPEVREFLLMLQRRTAEKTNVIMDGRDVGTVILPNADLKIFLTATPEDRAERRYKEMLEKGIETTYEDVLRDINYRDKNDSSRKIAPLKPAEDAVIIDTTGNTLQQSFKCLLNLVRKKLRV